MNNFIYININQQLIFNNFLIKFFFIVTNKISKIYKNLIFILFFILLVKFLS